MQSYYWYLTTQIVQWICLVLSIVVNTFLLLMINLKSPKNIGQYRYLMVSFSTFCLFLSVLTALGRPTFVAHGHCFIVFSAIDKETLPAPLRWGLTTLYSTTSAISVCLTAVQFIYRYCVICRPSSIRYFSGKRLLYWYLGIGVVIVDWLFLCIGPARKRAEITEYMRAAVEVSLEVKIDELEYLGVQFVHINNQGEEVYNMEAIFLIINIVVILSTVSLISFYCGLKTYFKSLTIVKSNNFDDEFNNQIFFALIAQTSIPFVFMFTPIMVIVSAPLLNFDAGVLIFISTMSMAIYPIIDPLAVLFIVSNYRKSLVPMLKPNKWRQIVQSKLIASQATVETIDVDIL